MRFLENRMLAKKTGSGHPGDIGAMRDHHKFSFLVCLNHGLKKIQESGQFGTKPETGPNLSGKFFSRKNSKFIHTFDGMIEISLGSANFSNSNTWSIKITTTTTTTK